MFARTSLTLTVATVSTHIAHAADTPSHASNRGLRSAPPSALDKSVNLSQDSFSRGSPAGMIDTRSYEMPAANPTNEMSRVLGISPSCLASDSSGGAIAHWHHGALHDVVEPMTDHVIMAYNGSLQRIVRRSGKSVETGTPRPGVVTIIPAGSSSRWDIPKPLDVVHLYLPQTTLKRVAEEAGSAAPSNLLERTAHPDPVTSQLLLSAVDGLESNGALDTLYRQQLTNLLATRLLSAHTGETAAYRPALGGLAPATLTRAIERLCSDCDADVSLTALASEAGLSRFHFCRAFKESTGLPPHSWLRLFRLDQAMTMLSDPKNSIATIAVSLGYASQTAFAAAFRKLTGETPTDWRKRRR